MHQSPDRSKRTSSPESGTEVRYSARYLQKREQFTRRSLFWGGLAFLVAGASILYDSIGAFQTGKLVSMGLRVLPPLPAFLAAPFGAFLVVVGFALLGARLLRRK